MRSRSIEGAGRRKGDCRFPVPLDNAQIASLLAREGVSAHGHLALALKRASRSALLWPEEAAELLARGRALTGLEGVGPNLSRLITGWIESAPPKPPHIEPLGFLTIQAKRVLAEKPLWSDKLKGDLTCILIGAMALPPSTKWRRRQPARLPNCRHY